MKVKYSEIAELGVEATWIGGEPNTVTPGEVALISIAKSLKRIADNSDKLVVRMVYGPGLSADDVFELSRR